MINRIALLTSGGDAPGMNAAVRAVVRTASSCNIEVIGVRRGFAGLIEGDSRTLGPRDVANIIQRGGTILLSARSKDFLSREGRARAAENLHLWDVDGLVIIGGDGSCHGGQRLLDEFSIPVIGIPGTIDNDLFGSDFTIGYDTAVETALSAIDKLRDTAASHERIFVVEVMGRNAGFIALDVAVAGGAEEVLIPEAPVPIDSVIETVQESLRKGKTSSIIVVADGVDGGALQVRQAIEQATGHEVRATILGHIQRGGTPTAADRILASRLGEAAVKALVEGRSGVMVGIVNGNVHHTALPLTWERRKEVNPHLYACAKTLSI